MSKQSFTSNDKQNIRSIRGIHDALPDMVQRWIHIENIACDIFNRYGFDEVRLPILEPTELFVRSVGQKTDIVAKEMYRFIDTGGDDLCLRPEGTAGAVRAWLQAGMARAGGVQRWYYSGAMFRRERPQKGRLRQFQQIGVEMFGAATATDDAELLRMAKDLLDALNINARLELNSLGCELCRPIYHTVLMLFLQIIAAELCPTCQDRMQNNPMRVLDCKSKQCQILLQDAPEMHEYLCDNCDTHFTNLQQQLHLLDVPFVINGRIVRGLDYYNRTAFEFIADGLGAQSTVLAGGRYDGLVEQLGGKSTPAVGFALGLERLTMLLTDINPITTDMAVVALGVEAQKQALIICHRLRTIGWRVLRCGTSGAKAQFKRANKLGVPQVLVIGDDELAVGEVTLKNMNNGTQERISIDKLYAMSAPEK
ncbi:MAG: histidine--tRNA ligase [Mariprofundales bacterium]